MKFNEVFSILKDLAKNDEYFRSLVSKFYSQEEDDSEGFEFTKSRIEKKNLKTITDVILEFRQ